jgi:hypothetical protein
MKIARCVPLAGQGVVARYGDLVAVTDGGGTGPDPLIGALTAVAAAAGDGRALVLAAVRAALKCPGAPAWACAGVTAEGGVAVLVHGRAVATVRVQGGQDVTLTAGDSVIPVSRTFTGMTVAVSLAAGDPVAPDPRFWLDGGVMPGGGLAVTMSADVAGPTMIVPDAAPSAGLPEATPTVTSTGTMDAVPGWHPPTVPGPAPEPDDWVPAPESADSARGDGPEPALVDGVLCLQEHFNDPDAQCCRQCGIGMGQLPRTLRRRQRPPLGVLVLDDGTQFPLDRDYVIGREPLLDGDVMAGRARPLRVCDPEGSVSRLHLRISLVGWQVEISDLGSANGSVLHSADGEHALAPFEPTVIEPGARIGLGRRSIRYLFHQGVLP